MSQLGERLREARESQGISISQAAVETRILQRYIVALEDGDFQHLPGDVYARGFIRNYAEYLNIPAEELIELYRRERGMSEPIRVVPVTSAPRVRSLMIPSFFGVFFVVLVLVGASYLLLSTLNVVGSGSQNQVAAAPTQAPTPPPLPTAIPRATDAPVVALAPTSVLPNSAAGGVPLNGTAPTATISPDAPIIAEVSLDPSSSVGSWLEIKVDGQSVFRKVLGPGQSLPAYKAQRDFWLRAGNASVVSVVVNGQRQCCTANPGDVVTFSWPPR
jgi:transcriptional regulator with XRE-family HTH domain